MGLLTPQLAQGETERGIVRLVVVLLGKRSSTCLLTRVLIRPALFVSALARGIHSTIHNFLHRLWIIHAQRVQSVVFIGGQSGVMAGFNESAKEIMGAYGQSD